MIVIITHSALDGSNPEGMISAALNVLIENKYDFFFIKHSILGTFKSKFYIYEKGLLKREGLIFTIRSLPVARYITEILSTFVFLFSKNKGENIIIGVDPLNALVGLILRLLGRAKKVVFYTPDYSVKRFDNLFLNQIYHFIDRLCVKYSDQVWNVSSRICKVRKEMGLIENRNIFLPNIPSENYKRFLHNVRNRNILITLGALDEQIDYLGLFDAIAILKKSNPSIILKVVGSGPKELFYKNYIKRNNLDRYVIFLGQIDHDKALEEMSRSGIGFALYNGKWGFNYYGDSMKCREYFSFGLPVITTDTHSTVEEIIECGAGVVCDLGCNNYVNAVLEIYKNYNRYSNSSYGLGSKYDKSIIILNSLCIGVK